MRRLVALAALPLVLSCDPAQAADSQLQKTCTERYAREAGRLSYLEAKLGVTDRQRPTWVRWNQWVLQGSQQQRDACLAALPKGSSHPTALEEDQAQEKILQIRIQTLQAARPALQDLYAVLTPDQKQVMDEGTRSFDGSPHRN